MLRLQYNCEWRILGPFRRGGLKSQNALRQLLRRLDIERHQCLRAVQTEEISPEFGRVLENSFSPFSTVLGSSSARSVPLEGRKSVSSSRILGGHCNPGVMRARTDRQTEWAVPYRNLAKEVGSRSGSACGPMRKPPRCSILYRRVAQVADRSAESFVDVIHRSKSPASAWSGLAPSVRLCRQFGLKSIFRCFVGSAQAAKSLCPILCPT